MSLQWCLHFINGQYHTIKGDNGTQVAFKKCALFIESITKIDGKKDNVVKNAFDEIQFKLFWQNKYFIILF